MKNAICFTPLRGGHSYLGLFNAIALLPVRVKASAARLAGPRFKRSARPQILLIVCAAAPSNWAGLNSPILGWIVLKGIFDNVLSDYLWARSVVLTTPTVATVCVTGALVRAIHIEHARPGWPLADRPARVHFGLCPWERRSRRALNLW